MFSDFCCSLSTWDSPAPLHSHRALILGIHSHGYQLWLDTATGLESTAPRMGAFCVWGFCGPDRTAEAPVALEGPSNTGRSPSASPLLRRRTRYPMQQSDTYLRQCAPNMELPSDNAATIPNRSSNRALYGEQRLA